MVAPSPIQASAGWGKVLFATSTGADVNTTTGLAFDPHRMAQNDD